MAVNDFGQKKAEHKFQVEAGEDEGCATFILGDEDHTLGNALRHVLMQTKGTEFCGYTVPHPSEPYVHLRLQTSGDIPALDQLRTGLSELSQSCSHMDDLFGKACEEFDQTTMDE